MTLVPAVRARPPAVEKAMETGSRVGVGTADAESRQSARSRDTQPVVFIVRLPR